MDLEKVAEEIILEAVNSVKANVVINNSISLEENTLIINEHKINLNRHPEIHVVGAGKAGAEMAAALEYKLGDWLYGGFVITKYEHTIPTEKITIKEASHPVLDTNTLTHTASMLKYIKKIPLQSLVITVISGGGSALLEVLPKGIKLEDLQTVVKELLNCGAAIQEINTIRKHLSQVKGGRLLEHIFPRENVTLIISDVIGDPVEFIASGPTAPDSTTFLDAWNILKKYNLIEKTPLSIIKYLEKGQHGKIAETPKKDNEIFKKNTNIFIAHNISALKVIDKLSREKGFNPVVLGGMIEGEAREIGHLMAGIARSIQYENYPHKKPAAVIWGGESTVVIKGKGKGGRNLELALAFLNKMKNEKFKFCYIACGTDGTDGPTDAAGAIVSGKAIKNMKKLDLNPDFFLSQNDSYHFWEKVEGLLITGPTQTNVMDINLLLVM
ncbi:MAG: glycerate kinase [Calditrichia bacterium]|nr:glycerate kinase [Calditrichia bacterium]